MDSARSSDSISPEPVALSRRTAALRIGGGGLAALIAGGLVPVAAQEASPTAGTPAAGRAYLVIRQYRFVAGRSMAELAETVGAGFLPIVSQVPGFLEYYLVETADGPLSISVFQDQTGMDESTQRAANWVQQNLSGFFEGPPTVTTSAIWIHQI